MKIAICDDDREELKDAEEFCRQTASVSTRIYTYEHAEELKSAIRKPDMQGNILLMDIRNSYIADEKKDGNDRESAWHGYGIRNIREIVNQYDGEIDFETEGTAFVVHVGLETELYM